ncbi:hypothetical protein [Sphingobacterium mizutaii]
MKEINELSLRELKGWLNQDGWDGRMGQDLGRDQDPLDGRMDQDHRSA